MKMLIVLGLIAMPFQFSATARAAGPDVTLKVVPISDAYVPSGFDSTSDSFVVENGWFPNSCYKLRDVQVNHVGPSLHEVTTNAEVTRGLCLAVIIPFHKEVHLGKLVAGTHQVHFLNGDGTYLEKQLVIER